MFTSYKDIRALVNLNNSGFEISIVNLTFINIEESMRRRLIGNTERDQTMEDINSRIKWALKDTHDYFRELQIYPDITVYTDRADIDETYQTVCEKLKLKRKGKN